MRLISPPSAPPAWPGMGRALLTEHRRQAAGVEAVGALGLPQGGHHDRRQHPQQLPALGGVESGRRPESPGDRALLSAEDVAEDAGAGAPSSVQQGREVVQDAAVVVAIEGAGERGGAGGRLRVARERPDECGEGGTDRLLRRRVIGAELLAHLAHRITTKLLHETVEQGRHEGPRVGSAPGARGRAGAGSSAFASRGAGPRASKNAGAVARRKARPRIWIRDAGLVRSAPRADGRRRPTGDRAAHRRARYTAAPSRPAPARGRARPTAR